MVREFARGKAGGMKVPGWESTAGSKSRNAKLTEEQALEILKLKGSGRLQKDIAAEYGINAVRVSEIWNRKAWRHLKLEIEE